MTGQEKKAIVLGLVGGAWVGVTIVLTIKSFKHEKEVSTRLDMAEKLLDALDQLESKIDTAVTDVKFWKMVDEENK